MSASTPLTKVNSSHQGIVTVEWIRYALLLRAYVSESKVVCIAFTGHGYGDLVRSRVWVESWRFPSMIYFSKFLNAVLQCWEGLLDGIPYFCPEDWGVWFCGWVTERVLTYQDGQTLQTPSSQFYKGHLSVAHTTVPFPFASWCLSPRSPTYSQEKCDGQDAETPKGGMKWLRASKWSCPRVFIKGISRGVLRCTWWAKTCTKSEIQTHINPSRSTNAHKSGIPLDLGTCTFFTIWNNWLFPLAGSSSYFKVCHVETRKKKWKLQYHQLVETLQRTRVSLFPYLLASYSKDLLACLFPDCLGSNILPQTLFSPLIFFHKPLCCAHIAFSNRSSIGLHSTLGPLLSDFLTNTKKSSVTNKKQ